MKQHLLMHAVDDNFNLEFAKRGHRDDDDYNNGARQRSI